MRRTVLRAVLTFAAGVYAGAAWTMRQLDMVSGEVRRK